VSNHENKMSVNVRKIIYAGVLIALGLLLPQVFHVFGQGAGMIFLPIHIPILLAGAILGKFYGAAVGLIVPILSFALTNMPPIPMLWFMIFELVGYGFAMGLLAKRCNIYIALVISMLFGRIVYGIALGAGVILFGMDALFMSRAGFVGSVVRGMPGMVIQLAIIPIIYLQLKNGGFLFDEETRGSKKDTRGTKS